MKKTCLLLAVLATFFVWSCASSKTSTAQAGDDVTVVQETKKERKAREKQQKQRVDSLAHEKAVQAIVQRHFALTASQVRVGRIGYPVSGLNEDANYVLMQGDAGIVQVALGGPSPGLNGLGGITLPGNIKGFEITQGKNGDVYVSYSMISSRMNADVYITLYGGGDKATAQVTPTLGSDKIELIGQLVPYRNKDLKIDP
ncbi:MAG: DUF4251 domain-containing protein [Muribaculaceae bacterium]|nr:DUF4251 domain-containing protein [Muribaculaceae bacterium]